MAHQAAALVDDGPAGAGELAVYLQYGFMGPEADRRVALLVLGEADGEFPVQLPALGRCDLQLHVHRAALYPRQPQGLARYLDSMVFHLIPAKLLQLPDGLLVQPALPDGELPGQGHLAEPRLWLGAHVAGVPVLHPADHDPSAVRGEHGLGRIEVNSVVNRLVVLLREDMALLLIGADQAQRPVSVVVLEAPGQHVLGAGEEYLLSVQLEEVRALPHPAEAPVVLRQYPLVLPVQTVGAAVEQNLAVLVPGAVPCHAVIAPVLPQPSLGVAEVVPAAALRQGLFREHRVLRQLLIVPAVPQGDALGLDFMEAAVRLGLMEHARIHQ